MEISEGGRFKYLVVGGGVAGVCCVEELFTLLADNKAEDDDAGENHQLIGLISGQSGYIKVVTNAEKIGQIAESFEVEERSIDALSKFGRIHVFQDNVVEWNALRREVRLSDGTLVHYEKLCIATGARPKCSLYASVSARTHIFTLRDVDSVTRLRARISNGSQRRVVIVGNGGIASELVFELEGVEEIVWAIRHGSISATYFDEAASRFFSPKLEVGRRAEMTVKPEARLDRFTVYQRPLPQHDAKITVSGCQEYKSRDEESKIETQMGCSLGPHWLSKLSQTTSLQAKERRVRVIRDTQVRYVYTQEEYLTKELASNVHNVSGDGNWSVWVKFERMEDGASEILGADFIVEATGVTPNSDLWAHNCTELKIAADGGICVDEMFCTTVPNVYAVGDVCTLNDEKKPHWMQIRLWTQARQMGLFAARSMAMSNVLSDICFELFTHVTTFFGCKVVLLGDFMAAKLTKPYQIHYRIRPLSSSFTKKKATHSGENRLDSGNEDCDDGGEYIKIISRDGRIHGAVLIGETELEETMENLILNQLDISAIEKQLLDPDIDLEDYFD